MNDDFQVDNELLREMALVAIFGYQNCSNKIPIMWRGKFLNFKRTIFVEACVITRRKLTYLLVIILVITNKYVIFLWFITKVSTKENLMLISVGIVAEFVLLHIRLYSPSLPCCSDVINRCSDKVSGNWCLLSIFANFPKVTKQLWNAIHYCFFLQCSCWEWTHLWIGHVML